jgi:hypothetical protein
MSLRDKLFSAAWRWRAVPIFFKLASTITVLFLVIGCYL